MLRLVSEQRSYQIRGGPSLEFSTDCFTNGNWYEIFLDVKITKATDNSIFECYLTYMYYSSYSCAGVHFLVGTQIQQIAYTIAPLRNIDGSKKINVVFKAN